MRQEKLLQAVLRDHAKNHKYKPEQIVATFFLWVVVV
jgi:hypothetical protein